MRRRVILFLMMTCIRMLWFVVPMMLAGAPAVALADIADALDSIVRIKPDWPAAARGRNAEGAPRDPQGTGIAIFENGYIATNVHVLGAAETVDVMTEDGRTLPADIIGRDVMTDIALLKIDADLPVLKVAPAPRLAEPVCAIGNQFGLGLSVTCGVVSAVHRSGTGFNPVEDFIQTDAAVNPGGSGGALVSPGGQLLGMVSAIFTKTSDADIGINFAVSMPLLMRVVTDLKAHGGVRRGIAGFKAAPLPPSMASTTGGVLVESVTVGGPAFEAGLDAGDVVTHVDGVAVAAMPSLETRMFMKRPGDAVALRVLRGESARTLSLTLAAP